MTRLTFQEQINHDKALQVSKVFKTSELELIALLKHADELGYFKKLGFGSLYEYAHLGLGLSEAVYRAMSNSGFLERGFSAYSLQLRSLCSQKGTIS